MLKKNNKIDKREASALGDIFKSIDYRYSELSVVKLTYAFLVTNIFFGNNLCEKYLYDFTI